METGASRPWIVISGCVANRTAGVMLLEKRTMEGESPVWHLLCSVYGTHFKSRVPRDWSVKWVVDFI